MCLPSPQEERRSLIPIFVVAKRRYYHVRVRHVMPLGPKILFPIDLHWERDSADNFFLGESTSQYEHLYSPYLNY